MIALAGITVARRIESPLNSALTPPARYTLPRVNLVGGVLTLPLVILVEDTLLRVLPLLLPLLLLFNIVLFVLFACHAATCCFVFKTSNGCVHIAAIIPDVAPDKKVISAGYPSRAKLACFDEGGVEYIRFPYTGRNVSNPNQYIPLKGQSRSTEEPQPREEVRKREKMSQRDCQLSHEKV